MKDSSRRRWTPEEALAVLSLYCQIPFGKMHSQNPEVRRVAKAVDRTASAVALKLVNFASLDPDHQNRGIKGMAHASKLDRQVWHDYYGRWEELVDAVPAQADLIQVAASVQETDSLVLVRARRRQSFFRRMVCSAYDLRCCITGIGAPSLLRASHIIPWSVDASVRLDPRNGLALNALHDAAFDRGLITVDESLRVAVSPRLASEMPDEVYHDFFQRYDAIRITLPQRFQPSQCSLKYHRDHVFIN